MLKPIRKAFVDADYSSLNVNDTKDNEKSLLISAEGLAILRTLHKQILPFLLRRTKAIALPDLPPKIIKDIYCPLSKKQKLLYASYQQGLRLSDDLLERELLEHLRGKSSDVANRVHPFHALLSLKKICIHPSLVQPDKSNKINLRIQDSGKLCLLIHLLIDQEVASCSEETLRELNQIWKSFSELPPFPIPTPSGQDMVDEDEDIEEDSDDDGEEVEQSTAVVSTTTTPSQPINNSDLINRSSRRKKCLIFAEHRETLDLIEHVFRQYFPHLSYTLMDGRTNPKKRAEIAMLFNSTSESQSPQVLLLTTSSCGLGLNLSAAEMVIFIEHSWNPFVDLQAMDRVHRLGQIRTVTVFKLLGKIEKSLLLNLIYPLQRKVPLKAASPTSKI